MAKRGGPAVGLSLLNGLGVDVHGVGLLGTSGTSLFTPQLTSRSMLSKLSGGFRTPDAAKERQPPAIIKTLITV